LGQTVDISAGENLEQRVNRLEERISQLEQALALAQKHLEAAAAPARDTSAEAILAVEEVVSPKLTKVDELDQQVRVLARQRELDQEDAAVKAGETPQIVAGRDGFGFKSGEGDFQLNTSGYVQADGRAFTGGGGSQVDTFLLRRVRPVLQGTLYKYIGFRVMPDFGEGKAVLQDAYLELRYFPAASLRAGKFKAPFGLERLQSAIDLKFVERGLPTDLVPNRDLGVQLGGDLANSRLTYAFGLFNGTPDGGSVDTDTNDGKDFVARVFGTPFPGAGRLGFMGGLGVGFAVSAGTQDGALPSFKSSAQSTFFTYANGVTASGGRTRYSPQAHYYYGPFGLIAELVRSNQSVAKSGARSELSNSSWQVAGSYLLTGDKATFKRLSPLRDFNIGAGTWGAWELVARIGELSVDPKAFALGLADPSKSARRAHAWAVGVNWYLNRNVKIGLNYERTSFTGGTAGGDRDSEGTVLSRFQLAF
jgi:phosphate-selective porin OprO/OprP